MLESPPEASLSKPRVPPPPLTTAEWLLLLVLASIQFTHILDFMILMPLGPRYLKEMHISTFEFGLLVSAYAFSAGLSGLLAAFFIDRFDRKRSLLFLYCGFILGTLLCAVASNYMLLFLGRCVAGTFGGIAGAVTLAAVGDVFREERRGLATGVIMSSFSVATIVGVPLGLKLAQYFGTSAPFFILTCLCLMILAVAVVVLPRMRQHLTSRTNPLAADHLAQLIKPAHLRAYALMVSLVLGMFMLVPFMATYLVYNVRWEEKDLWQVYLCGGAGTILTLSFFGSLADRFGKLPVFRVLALLTIIPILLVTNLQKEWAAWTLVITTLFMIVTSGRMVPAMAMITSSAAPTYRGSFMSVVASVQQFASALAGLVAGFVVHQGGAALTGGGEGGGIGAPLEGSTKEPLEGYWIVGLLACITTVASVYLAGFVKPHATAPTKGEHVEVNLDTLTAVAETL